MKSVMKDFWFQLAQMPSQDNFTVQSHQCAHITCIFRKAEH